MKKQKIFFITPNLVKGGAQRVVCSLSNYFDDHNFSVGMIVLGQGIKAGEEIAYPINKDVNTFILSDRDGRYSVFYRLYFAFSMLFKFFYYIIKYSPSHIISFTTAANIWTGVVAKILGIPYIVSERTIPDRTINKFHPIKSKIVCWLYKKSSAIVVPSKGLKDELLKNKNLQDAKNLKVIRNPVTTFKTLSGIPVHYKPFILAVGRLHFVKGFDLLINAYNELKINDIDLIIVGDGEEREKLQKQISSLGLNNSVFLVGKKDNMQDYYSQSKLFVLSSRNEGYPNVLIEAMSFGCVSVAVDCITGPSEIIENGINGMLIENGNVSLLSKTMAALLQDDVLRANMSVEARRIGEANSMSAISSMWKSLIIQHD
ncbi:MAG: group 1 glycosyl transferase [Sphingobacteriales bacterium]|nr:group 1 glycosyl transferase [Sphingobacteriales bacterium]